MFPPMLAILLIQAGAAPPEPYQAIGTDPLWQASIYGDAMTFETHGRDRLHVQAPRRRQTAQGFEAGGAEFTMMVEHADCTDSLNGRTYADRVTVRAGAEVYRGCGGAVRGPALPEPYGAGGGEPFWSMGIAGGRLYFGVNDEVVIVPAPTPVVTGNGGTRRYTAPGIDVLLRRENCELEDERVYADAVTVRAGHWTVEGCGGPVVREAPDE